MSHSMIISIVALVVSLVSAAAGAGRYFVARRQIRTQNLLQISNFLHQTEYREARQSVRTAAAEDLDNAAVRKLCSSFDFAALFVRNDLVDKKLFIRYWEPLFVHLCGHLKKVREEPAFAGITMGEYYRDFFWLLDEVEKSLRA